VDLKTIRKGAQPIEDSDEEYHRDATFPLEEDEDDDEEPLSYTLKKTYTMKDIEEIYFLLWCEAEQNGEDRPDDQGFLEVMLIIV